MSKHVAEALVLIPDAEAVTNAVCARSREYCLSVSTSKTYKLLDFGDGSAILKPNSGGLRLKVEAQDLVTFYGIRTLLQAQLFAAAMVPEDVVRWHSESDAPFEAVRARPQHPGTKMPR